jgi:hypothetical protein
MDEVGHSLCKIWGLPAYTRLPLYFTKIYCEKLGIVYGD